MSIHIHRNGEQSGPFEENIVIEQLRSGQLSPDDLGIRTGGSEWRPLRVLFPDVERTSETGHQNPVPAFSRVQPSTASLMNDPPVKTGGGCRKIFGTFLLIAGSLLTLGGFGLAIFNRVMPDHFLCQEADKVIAEVKQLTADREKAKGTPAEAEIARKQIEKTTRMGIINKACGDMENYYLWWFVAFLISGAVGFVLALVGFFVRRVRSS